MLRAGLHRPCELARETSQSPHPCPWIPVVKTGHRYSLAVSLAIRNLLNHNNPGPIIGNITSSLFGRANQPYGVGSLGGTGFSESADNRRLEFQTRLTF